VGIFDLPWELIDGSKTVTLFDEAQQVV